MCGNIFPEKSFPRAASAIYLFDKLPRPNLRNIFPRTFFRNIFSKHNLRNNMFCNFFANVLSTCMTGRISRKMFLEKKPGCYDCVKYMLQLNIALKISLEISATPCCILNRFGHGVFKQRSINKLMSRYCDTKSSSPITATQNFCGELSRHNCFQRALSNYRAVIFFESGYGCMIF